jgi:hypothetical protein
MLHPLKKQIRKKYKIKNNSPKNKKINKKRLQLKNRKSREKSKGKNNNPKSHNKTIMKLMSNFFLKLISESEKL